ncbi:MAG: glycosyltransferase family 1 protein [Anaerolineae bacterium]
MTIAPDRPIRILQVVGGMNRAGVETWLLNVLRHIDRQRFQMDFLVHTDQPCAYDDEVRALGSRIIPCLHPSRPWQYARSLRRILREYGPYDVVHSHVHHYSGWVLRAADRAEVPIRIAHSHNDTNSLQDGASALRRIYLRLTERWIAQHATVGLACSRPAATALYGPRWTDDERFHLLHCGIDLAPFRKAAGDGAALLRAELGLPKGAQVIGHVGRFHPQKNHTFIVNVFAEAARREPRAHLLLVGDGPLRPDVDRQARHLGLADRVTFAGLRDDVPRLMLGAMDALLMPSRWEGLPVTLLEAQAAGLPCVISDVIADEADVVPELVHRLALQQPPDAWAEAVLACAGDRPITQTEALARIERSDFSIPVSVMDLEVLYGSGQ